VGDRVTFNPTISPTPVFVGRGSVMDTPDILPMFLGPYWPGTGAMTVDTIMNALRTMASGAYLDGLKQYGYGGAATVRAPRVDQGFGGFLLGLAPNAQTVIDQGVDSYIDNLIKHDDIDNADDNHELIVVVFLDPSVPNVPNPNVNGSTILGDNGKFEHFELFDDNIRFQRAWVSTTSGDLATVTQILSHELAESISDPFNNGWYRQTPPAPATSDQITDICNQNGLSDGVAVTAYWSNSDGHCVIPTSGTRAVWLTQTTQTTQQPDGPVQQAFVDLGAICGGGQMFDFVQRTWVHNVRIAARIEGFEAQSATWTINGQAVPVGGGNLTVDATVDVPTASGVKTKSGTAQLATFNAGAGGSEMSFSVQPGSGNVSLEVRLTVQEQFDIGPSALGSTVRRGLVELDLKNQEVEWSTEFKDANANCERVKHLKNTPTGPFGVPTPGDPGGLGERVKQVIGELNAVESNLLQVADAAQATHPEVAAALRSLAKGTV
jgi:hypothetical protein